MLAGGDPELAARPKGKGSHTTMDSGGLPFFPKPSLFFWHVGEPRPKAKGSTSKGSTDRVSDVTKGPGGASAFLDLTCLLLNLVHLIRKR